MDGPKALDLPVKSERLFGFLDDIAGAVAGVAENAVDIAGNVGDIVANGVGIAGNVGDIVANGVGIAGNLADIGSNFKTIQTNEANILTNYDGIQALETMGPGSVWFDAYRYGHFIKHFTAKFITSRLNICKTFWSKTSNLRVSH